MAGRFTYATLPALASFYEWQLMHSWGSTLKVASTLTFYFSNPCLSAGLPDAGPLHLFDLSSLRTYSTASPDDRLCMCRQSAAAISKAMHRNRCEWFPHAQPLTTRLPQQPGRPPWSLEVPCSALSSVIFSADVLHIWHIAVHVKP